MTARTALAAAALAAAAAMAAPAGMAAAGPTAAETIASLRDQGYSVNIDRVGSAPLEDCVVTNVRNPNTVTATRRDNDGDRYVVVISKTIQVSLAC
ncbi:hypothetical protein LV457_01430 [Mycobacterium sp. MYCO198283]|uniref:hypothetical protein n=1 Tax=Mycobacterium sp. MYCO198283 TaxID=2883505 RepID=UPI001E34EBAB|nr:hypothetical protein [Mycobacterium sp. MYCO198283]MCG5430959.1 hypothetical protein [Mycobacterium sp. MYCO198283]